MKRIALVALIALAGCKEEVASLPLPVAITAESLGHYCQMHLIEHDGPKGQAHLDGMAEPLFFSQVRDAVAYLHMPEQSHAVTVTYVQDMAGATWDAPGPWIDARDAVYVIGSDAVGGMGAPEFVPFGDAAAAAAFAEARGGEVRAFDAIPAEMALAPAGLDHDAADDHADMATRLHGLGH
jgi:copper chaperone NosL